MDFDVKTENFEKTRLSIVKLAVWLVYNAFLILYNGYRMMLGSKDAIRIVPYFVLPQFYPIFAYREAYAPLLCSYRGGSLSHKTTPVQAHRGFRLLTLASYNVLSAYMIDECFDFFFVFYTVCLNGTAHIDRPRMTLSNTFCNVFCIQSAS